MITKSCDLCGSTESVLSVEIPPERFWDYHYQNESCNGPTRKQNNFVKRSSMNKALFADVYLVDVCCPCLKKLDQQYQDTFGHIIRMSRKEPVPIENYS